MQWFSSLESSVKTKQQIPQNRAQNIIANSISDQLVLTQWTLNYNPKKRNLKCNSPKIDMKRHNSSIHDRIVTLSTQTHRRVCVCVHQMQSVCKLWQSVKTHNHMMFQNQRNMIIPTTIVFQGIHRNTRNV